MASINSHGNINEDNYNEAVEKTKIYGPLRVELSKLVKNILNQNKYLWTIDAGTLLGAFRDNGKMLKHDDDFDFVVYAHDIIPETTEYYKKTIDYLIRLKKNLDDSLPKPYKTRIVTTYCKKIEVYDPDYGEYGFNPLPDVHTNYHNVTCDIMLILRSHDSPHVLVVQHEKLKNVSIPAISFFPHEMPFPIIQYEGNIYNCPSNPAEYLESLYGYIGRNAIYNKDTGFYERK